MEQHLYYIQTEGYVGNAMIWWRPEHRGYTPNINEAGKYSTDEAMKICENSDKSRAWPCEYIDSHPTAKKLIVDMQHIDYNAMMGWKRKD